ncbi:MAG TPA: LysR family transcriptional regulator [bacterium]|jgi:DNA-binding transcriptional LysR family regulator|nr:LysR family transcriptional regulator [bacterium]
MRNVNDFLNTLPFDLYELSLFHLVVKHRSFTKAAEVAGLTQSAITRQMQGMEDSLGIDLLERTTRSVRVTQAGEFLYSESAKLLGDVDNSLRRLKEDYANSRKEIRIGVSRSIGLAYLPGFFHANLRKGLKASYRVAYQPSADILSALEANELDLGVLCPPPRLPKTLIVTHRFTDAFTFIASSEAAAGFQTLPKSKTARLAWLQRQSWLLPEESTNTGRELRQWMSRSGLKIEPAMQLDSFDLIITLVSLGLGISFVPKRALALYGQKKNLVRVHLPDEFKRELVVLMRKHRKQPKHLTDFVENILF